jgi:uncharacterized protein with HEPN domain
MTSHDDAIGLQHMLDHVREAVALVQNMTCDDLHANRVLSLALVRLLEIVGKPLLEYRKSCAPTNNGTPSVFATMCSMTALQRCQRLFAPRSPMKYLLLLG